MTGAARGDRTDRTVTAARLGELAEVGASWAAKAFEELVGSPVEVRGAPLRGEALDRPDDWSTGLFFQTDGRLPGLVGLFLTTATRARVAQRLLGADPGEAVGSAVESALREFGNILASQTISAIANELGERILVSVPELAMDGAVASFTARLPERRRGRAAPVVERELFHRGELRVLLVFAPDPDPPGAA